MSSMSIPGQTNLAHPDEKVLPSRASLSTPQKSRGKQHEIYVTSDSKLTVSVVAGLANSSSTLTCNGTDGRIHAGSVSLKLFGDDTVYFSRNGGDIFPSSAKISYGDKRTVVHLRREVDHPLLPRSPRSTSPRMEGAPISPITMTLPPQCFDTRSENSKSPEASDEEIDAAEEIIVVGENLQSTSKKTASFWPRCCGRNSKTLQ